jgi:type IV pilus assembly protein PilA
MKNKKGFTLIELIIVTIILGILSAVAVPRILGVLTLTEESAEDAVIANIRSGCEAYAKDMLISTGRKSYPPNPFDNVDVSTYKGVNNYYILDGEWTFLDQVYNGEAGSDEDGDGIDDALVQNAGLIIHRRSDDLIVQWFYSASDENGTQADDRGFIGERYLSFDPNQDIRNYDFNLNTWD